MDAFTKQAAVEHNEDRDPLDYQRSQFTPTAPVTAPSRLQLRRTGLQPSMVRDLGIYLDQTSP